MSTLQLLLIGLACVTYDVNARTTKPSKGQKPNIVIILVDDMGINDVSFHGSNQILTPNIDALAYNGVILNRLYVPSLCTPSRATLLTGKYPIHTGTQHSVIINDQPWGLPLNERTMPELFRDAGYSTNLIGKWHLGFSKKAYTPTLRGFDYHVGYYSGYIDYYVHDMAMLNKNYSRGYDFRRNLDINEEGQGIYATEYFTNEAIRVVKKHNKNQPLFLLMSHLAVHTGNEDNPMQAPPEEIAKFSHISDPKRRIYAAMISKLDESVGKLIGSLGERKMLDNTIILFYSDNGAPTQGVHSNAGSNYPFRGQKQSPWEGGIRSAGAIWSPLIKKSKLVSHQLIHSIDWLPTLASAAGIKLPSNLKIDGINLWPTLINNYRPKPRNFIHVLDDIDGYVSYQRSNLKYINGTEFCPKYATWLGDLEDNPDPRLSQYSDLILESQVSKAFRSSNLSAIDIEELRIEATYECNTKNLTTLELKAYKCEPAIAPCLFDIEKDPCEMYNIAAEHPHIIAELEADVEYYRQSAVEIAWLPGDPLANPGLHNNTWTWWKDSTSSSSAINNSAFNLTISLLLVLRKL
ncbi:arylsulfatase B-like [Eupeodes corollae]|uniref:arylsulfatase B-like n=1 Tax=Eupeodes corollae TaxID=290404 RepID=UPI0024922A58|nr:arylsulfatase B-like [Eupeodes corollae]XP_055904624.1 arylsulfatase B-like [Eupeodes corollae]XP_055904625.1 arylsulfatase B-like [Eupeodes corollae]XP_055904626.1 arylsulfatase B-like [Eupeodes corollae]XP_055904627.1 arylsulfatase B-like [Eupeodes corollae]XP_055904628.1 arylsulfatase B-like [Eupeodes corollae]